MTPDYDALLARAQRNFALCLVEIQTVEPVGYIGIKVAREWRKKADALQATMEAAAIRLSQGDRAVACKMLAEENDV